MKIGLGKLEWEEILIMKKNIRYVIAAFMAAVMLCGLNGCGINDNVDTEQIVDKV